MKKIKTISQWFWVALLASLLAVPHATIIRWVMVDGVDPYYWTMVRAVLAGLICLPFIVRYRRSLYAPQILRKLALIGLSMGLAIVLYTQGIAESSASYSAVILLLSPVFFIVLSRHTFRESLQLRSIVGIILAGVGASVIIVPQFLGSNPATAYPLATILLFANIVLFSYAIVLMRSLSEKGVNLLAQIGVSSWITAAVAGLFFLVAGNHDKISMTPGFWLAVVYSAVVIMIIVRLLKVWSFRYIGSVVMGGLMYLESFLGILFPLVVLRERLSLGMIIGGCIIAVGVYLTERHTRKTHAADHHHWFKWRQL